MSDLFDFEVCRDTDFDTDEPTDNWTVSLPHQCDAWRINRGGSYDGVPHAQAVADLEEFIAKAKEALVALKERREVER